MKSPEKRPGQTKRMMAPRAFYHAAFHLLGGPARYHLRSAGCQRAAAGSPQRPGMLERLDLNATQKEDGLPELLRGRFEPMMPGRADLTYWSPMINATLYDAKLLLNDERKEIGIFKCLIDTGAKLTTLDEDIAHLLNIEVLHKDTTVEVGTARETYVFGAAFRLQGSTKIFCNRILSRPRLKRNTDFQMMIGWEVISDVQGC